MSNLIYTIASSIIAYWNKLSVENREKIISAITALLLTLVRNNLKKEKCGDKNEFSEDNFKDEPDATYNKNSLETKIEIVIYTNLKSTNNTPTKKEIKFAKEVSSYIASKEFLDKIQDELNKIDINKMSEDEFMSQAENKINKMLRDKFINK